MLILLLHDNVSHIHVQGGSMQTQQYKLWPTELIHLGYLHFWKIYFKKLTSIILMIWEKNDKVVLATDGDLKLYA